MPSLLHLCESISASRFSLAIHKSPYWFPILEGIHTLGITSVVGTIAVLDLRLLGLIMKRERVSVVARQVLPWTWAGFAVMFVTGVLLSIAEAQENYVNTAFRVKLILLVLVGLNPLFFHLNVYKKVSTWDTDDVTPWRARFAAISSLVLWSGIVVAGRLIAYLNDATGPQ